jgi:hypothetical protein
MDVVYHLKSLETGSVSCVRCWSDEEFLFVGPFRGSYPVKETCWIFKMLCMERPKIMDIGQNSSRVYWHILLPEMFIPVYDRFYSVDLCCCDQQSGIFHCHCLCMHVGMWICVHAYFVCVCTCIWVSVHVWMTDIYSHWAWHSEVLSLFTNLLWIKKYYGKQVESTFKYSK